MEHRTALTLKPGDMLDIPGIGPRLIGAIDQTKHDRYLIRLDAKFKPSVTITVSPFSGDQRTPEQHEGSWESEPPAGIPSESAMVTLRIHSKDPQHMREDLAASLAAALGPDISGAYVAEAAGMVAAIHEPADAQTILREVLASFGPAVFGSLTLFHFWARTSLTGHVEALTHPESMANQGHAIRDLGWSADQLHERYLDQASPENPERDNRLRKAVIEWQKRYGGELITES